jgi:phosphinothricin acetyltransferase
LGAQKVSEVIIRRAELGDVPALLDIYNHYIVNTPTSFDIEPRTLAQRQLWFEQFKPSGPHQCFTAVRGKAPVGFACSYRFKAKAAYDTSVSTSIYIAHTETGRGLGRRLYETLFAALAGGPHRAYAGITLPNEASVGIHRAFGFKLIGTQHEVGRKFGKFWDVALYEKALD